MKVGIVTIPDYTNYGNRLQNYAVNHILQTKFGCETISLVSYKDKAFENGNYVLWLKNVIARQLCVFPELVEKRFGNNMTRWSNFYKWSKRYIPTKNFYGNKCLPESLNDHYDMFFAGSDQIWNYHFAHGKFYNYFLAFADNQKKVAISASFGVDELPEEWKQEYINGLKGFAHISVREDAGKSIVKELIAREVPVLIDPTMMLSKKEWLQVAKKPRVDCSRPYILKYYLGDENEEDKLDAWAGKNGYEIYELMNDKIPELYSAGPGEFISLISNAAMVCSDSFHCIAFSIIFSRPFVVYARQGKEDYMTSRLDTLLGKFGFQNRWKHLLSEDEYLVCDYTSVKVLLEKEQQKFLKYISNALKLRPKK